MSGEPFLWCAHIRGPDDVIPCPDYASALEICDFLLHKFDRALSFTVGGVTRPRDENDPYFSAVPAPWPWSAQDHAKALEERYSDPKSEWPLKRPVTPAASQSPAVPRVSPEAS